LLLLALIERRCVLCVGSAASSRDEIRQTDKHSDRTSTSLRFPFCVCHGKSTIGKGKYDTSPSKNIKLYAIALALLLVSLRFGKASGMNSFSSFSISLLSQPGGGGGTAKGSSNKREMKNNTKTDHL